MNVLIVGRAKTGTTVVSKTIENSLEGESSYSLEPKDLSHFFQPENYRTGVNHVTKIIYEHWNLIPRSRMALICNETPLKFDKRVFIVRDPRDELLSRLLYFIRPWTDANGCHPEKNGAWIEALKKKESNPAAISFLQMVTIFDEIYDTKMHSQVLQERGFQQFFNFTTKKETNGFTLRYEDFIVGEVEPLEHYLDQKLTDKRDVGVLSRTRRSASFNNWKSFFTEEDIAVLKPIYADLLQSMGYSDWELDSVDRLPADENSEYASRLVSQR